MSRAVQVLLLAFLSLILTPPAGGADGLPVPIDGFDTASVVGPDGEGRRYATVADGADTRLLRIDPDGGEITGSRTIQGNFSIPLVSVDGTPSGLSADGETLVLINPRSRFPRRETSFTIVDLKPGGGMRAQEPLTLQGDFSFDALSPDGATLFLIEYTSADYNDYAVREYDVQRGELLREPVQFSHEVAPGEMRGLPMTRATSPDGRWEYTLYNGGGRRNDDAFIHVLDTEESISHCIDLTMVNGQEAWRIDLTLAGDEGNLDVVRGADTLATLDTETFEVSGPPPVSTTAAEDDGGISGVAVGAIAAGIALIAGTAVGVRRRRRGVVLPADPFGPGDPDAVDEQVAARR